MVAGNRFPLLKSLSMPDRLLEKLISKLDQRRIIPLKRNLKAWLLPYRKKEGRICELV